MTKQAGWVHVICGPMYSGKTESLLRQVRRLDIRGKNLMVFKPETDTRSVYVQSRAGHVYPGSTVGSAQSILNIAEAATLEVVAIDEAQFLDTALVDVVDWLANRGTLVLVAGLDRDFLGRGFGPMPDLLVRADEVSKLAAVCFVCKGEASLTQRLVDGRPASPNDPLVVIGGMGDDKYEARCRSCWTVGH